MSLQQNEYEARAAAQYKAEVTSDPEFNVWNMTEAQKWRAMTPESQATVSAAVKAITNHAANCETCKYESPELWVSARTELGLPIAPDAFGKRPT